MKYEAGSKEAEVVRIVTSDPERAAIIASVSSMGLPECWIAGGFVCNRVWDMLFRNGEPTPHTDVDVVYFKPLHSYGLPEDELIALIQRGESNPVWEEEAKVQATLESLHPGREFEVKNQARMYFSPVRTTPHEKYTSISDAISGWVETATASGIQQTQDGSYAVLAPFSFDDLFKGILRPTQLEYTDRLRERAEQKGWLSHWPGVHVEPYDEVHTRRR